MSQTDVILGVFLTALAVLFWTVLIPYGVVVPKGATNLYLAPDFWIRILAGAMLIVGLLILLKGLRTKEVVSRDAIATNITRQTDRRTGLIKLGGAIAIFAFYYGTIDILGVVAGSAAALFAASLLYGEKRFYVTVPLALLLPITLYFFFLKVASIPMPMGILEGVGPF